MTATPRVGLVLGAGGVAGGAFHAGVLAALHEATGWDPRHAGVLVGTSAGSIAAASLRAGLSCADMLARAQDLPLSAEGRAIMQAVGPYRGPPPLRVAPRRRSAAQLAATVGRAAARPFAAPPWALLTGLLPEGSVSTDMIVQGVGGLFTDAWPTEPLWICAVRQDDGRRVVFGQERSAGEGAEQCPPVAEAVAASCAIPGFFAPVSIAGTAYVDGGVHSPTNADVLTDPSLGLDLVLVSSPMSISGTAGRLAPSNAVRRWSSLLLSAEAVRLRRRGAHVMAFQPTAADAQVMGSNAMDPSRRAAIARQAYESTLRRLARADTQVRLARLAG
ncbi:MAG: patatin-like phospholipase family protein [Ilumatobacteraceae bacterium]|nr:patatin-like phospholipase family protein [Ilumatobacteraceae bacterium]